MAACLTDGLIDWWPEGWPDGPTVAAAAMGFLLFGAHRRQLKGVVLIFKVGAGETGRQKNTPHIPKDAGAGRYWKFRHFYRQGHVHFLAGLTDPG